MRNETLVIIGSGAAGWTAAIYAARAGLKPLVIGGYELGGQMTIAGQVENFPGFPEAIDGGGLMQRMMDQALAYGARVDAVNVSQVDFSTDEFAIHLDGETIHSKAVIIATGATARWLGIKGEQDYMGRGVSACATCDGYFYKGGDVVVVGGGNTAVEEALLLSTLCRNVTIVHRRDSLRAEAILRKRLEASSNVQVIWNSTVREICGGPNPGDPVSHIILNRKGEDSILRTDGVFVAIGHDPATAFLDDALELQNGYIKVRSGSTATSVEGVFAAGDVADARYRQAVTAAGMGCMAALDAERWLSERGAI